MKTGDQNKDLKFLISFNYWGGETAFKRTRYLKYIDGLL